MASYARNHQQPYAQSGEQSYDQYERRQHSAFPGRSSTPPRQQQQPHQQQPPYRQAQPPSPMTIEQYQASRRATANMTPQRQRNVSPQRQRNATPQRAPPPGKFSTQPQNAYRPPPPPPPPQQQQAHSQPQYRQAQNPQYNQSRNMGQNLQYHQNPHQVQHPQYQYQNPQYPQSNNFTNQNTTQNYVQQKSAAAGMMAQNPLNRNVHQEQRQANSPMSRRDYFQQAQQMQLQQEDRQAVDMEDQYNMHIMREREAEVAAINAKMNKVNDIYKDLAGLIDGHQDLIDQVDVNIEESHAYTKGGITNYEEARLMMENPIMEDFFGDKLGKRPNSARPNTPREAGKRRVRKARDSNKRDKSSKYDDDEADFQCDGHFETIQENLIDAINEMKVFGSRVFLACTGPDVGANEYATYH